MKLPFFTILLALSLSGCSLIYSYSDNLPQRVDQWIIDNKYNTALNTIHYIKPTHKNYRSLQKKKKIIHEKMAAYENMAIIKSTKLSKQGEWIKAFKLIEQASQNLIDKKKIEQHRATLLAKRNKLIASYENKILYGRAKNLIDKIPLYEKINKTVSASERNQLDIAAFNDARYETSLRLAQHSERQYKNELYDDALTTIKFALKLNPEKEIVSRLKDIKVRVKAELKLLEASYLNKARTLLGKLSQGYSHLILKETKETITWLKNNKELSQLALVEKLTKRLNAGVKQRFEAARSLYSKGKTQEALSIWLELKELEPKNIKLQSHIERAEKILIKLKKLTNKPKK